MISRRRLLSSGTIMTLLGALPRRAWSSLALNSIEPLTDVRYERIQVVRLKCEYRDTQPALTCSDRDSFGSFTLHGAVSVKAHIESWWPPIGAYSRRGRQTSGIAGGCCRIRPCRSCTVVFL